MNKRGVYSAIGAFTLWGLFPLFWNLFGDLDSREILAHRMIWCWLVVTGLLFVTQGRRWLHTLFSQPRLMATLTLSACMIGVNWFLYIWAVTNGHIVETSLGYFINPLIKMLLGAIVFKERLNRMQWLAVAIVATAVAYFTYSYGSIPWIALTLAFSFATYGAIRKTTNVDSTAAVAFESFFFVPLGLGYLIWLLSSGNSNLSADNWQLLLLLVISGVITAVPLVLFANAARLIPLSTIGIIQFLAPSIQLVIGVTIFSEPFTPVELIGFGLIWLAVAVYTADAFHQRHS